MVEKQDCINFLRELIDVSISTVDENGNPQSRIIDIMHADEETVYFLTARGKRIYKQLEANNHVAIVGLSNNKTVRVIGEVEKLENQKEWIDLMFDENPFLNNVYPGDKRYILEPFKLVKGEMEFFDLNQKPIYRQSFTINTEKPEYFTESFKIGENCIGCGICYNSCPQQAILEGIPPKIQQEHCLHCGTCYENCPNDNIHHV
jgi:uncharacterized pyridoxamine 5'-phosphate oxidase family protein/NAD-dependent dihydropyrimidine dehydrogenase PreA subunit